MEGSLEDMVKEVFKTLSSAKEKVIPEGVIKTRFYGKGDSLP